jgi:hypothetical protein
MFLDGDAFPIADPMPLIEEALARAPLLAVRRAENVEEPQPHPCFCVTTVGTWRSAARRLDGRSDVDRSARNCRRATSAANLLRRLELTQTPWVQVLRIQPQEPRPLYFAIYGDAVYHHGAGFRAGELSPAHREHAPRALPASRVPPLQALRRLANGWRWRRWERATKRYHVRQSQLVYERIRGGGDEWLKELR